MPTKSENIANSLRTLGPMLRKYRKKIVVIAIGILLFQFCIQLLLEIEYAGQDPSVRGLRIIDWLKVFSPGKYKPLTESPPSKNVVLFPKGKDSIDGRYVIQGGVYDCRFLSIIASFASSPKGKGVLFEMIKENPDGTYTVTFPNEKGNPITIAPLTEKEVSIYARLEDRVTKQNKGLWLAVLEKAFGKYRIEHQDPYEHFLHFSKHALFEGRFTSSPMLEGFGASFGAKDDGAAVLLTGKPLNKMPTSGWEIGSFGLGKGYVSMRQIRSWFDRDKVRKEFEDEQHQALAACFKNGGIANAGTEVSPEASAHGLMSGHAYSVLGYDAEKRLLLISDPMGKGDFFYPEEGNAIKDGVNDGIFTLPLSEFNKYFSHVSAQVFTKEN